MWAVLHKRKLSSAQIILFGFALVILIGALLLMLPISSKTGTVPPFLNCLFTSTSAVCVTGLIVYDISFQPRFWNSRKGNTKIGAHVILVSKTSILKN